MAGTSYFTDEAPASGSEKITVSSVALGFTAAKILTNETGGFKNRAVRAFITVETNPIRILIDGTTPDATTGHLLNAGDTFTVDGEANVTNTRMIRTGSDATVQVTYWKNR